MRSHFDVWHLLNLLRPLALLSSITNLSNNFLLTLCESQQQQNWQNFAKIQCSQELIQIILTIKLNTGTNLVERVFEEVMVH